MDEPRDDGMPPARDTYGTARLEAFSDGVFAITATLLVLNIDIPELVGGNVHETLLHALGTQWPVYVAYVLSFLMIGIIWVNHHGMFHLIERTTHSFLILNVLFLMAVALIPFPTAIVARYLGEDPELAMVSYGTMTVVIITMFDLVWLYAAKNRRLLVPWFPDEMITRLNRRNFVGPFIYIAATALAFFWPYASLAIFIGLALFYLLPSRITREWESTYGSLAPRSKPGVSG